MGYLRSLPIFLTFFVCFSISSSLAYDTLYVGGNDGWVLHPSEPYDHWAERLRFVINDTIVFEYNNASDSVLQVNKDDFDNCNTQNPIISMTSGNSEFTFDHSGLFYFITGNVENCEKGQKLVILVISTRVPKSTRLVSPPIPSLPPAIQSPAPEGESIDGVTAPALAPSSTMVVSPSILISGVILFTVVLGVTL